MRKLGLAAWIFVLGISVNCRGEILNHELRSQFRVWKSSYFDAGNYTTTQISTSPIIFHTVISSGTVSSTVESNFILYQSTGMTVISSDASTKAIVGLDSSNQGCGIGMPFDILVTTHSYWRKIGGAKGTYLWDYLNESSFNRFPKD